MSWLSEDYADRAAISVPDSAGVATADIDTTIPPDWDEFWAAIDSNGYGIRVTTYDGRTAVSYAVDNGSGGAFDKTNRLGRIRIDGAAMPNVANTVALFWVYFDIDSPTNGSVAVTMTSIVTGYILQAKPSNRLVRAKRQPPGLTRPADIDSKATAATEHFWFDVAGLLQRYPRPQKRRLFREEIRAAGYAVLDDAGAVVGGMSTAADTRFVEIVDGLHRQMLVRVTGTGGTTGERYTVALTLRTGDPLGGQQTIVVTLGVVVRDVVEVE